MASVEIQGQTRDSTILKLISAAAAILTTLVIVALFALQAQTDSAAVLALTGTTTTTAPPATVAPPTTVAPRPEPASRTLRPGDNGPGVLALQERLRGLGYWLGSPDGAYGGLTVQAVMAFQKVEGQNVEGMEWGTAGPATTTALGQASRPEAASASGDLIEVDKERQVLFVVHGGTVQWILNVSTGTEEPYQLNGRTELADTPPGHWQVARAVDGVDVGDLGVLYRPRYFHRDGIAVHGYHDVPAYPASHGCVRLSNAAMDWLWAEDLMPIGSPLWVY